MAWWKRKKKGGEAKKVAPTFSTSASNDGADIDLPDHDIHPYLAARMEWNERYGGYIARERAWKMMAFACAGIAAVAVFGVVHIGSQSRIEPWIVEVGKLGDAFTVGPADRARPLDARIVRAQLARWAKACRVVFADVAAERAMIDECYGMLASQSVAVATMNSWFQAHSPFVRAQDATVKVKVNSVLSISEKVWRIEWEETDEPRVNGAPGDPKHWQADVSITISPPANADRIMINPAGVYVVSFSWSERL